MKAVRRRLIWGEFFVGSSESLVPVTALAPTGSSPGTPVFPSRKKKKSLIVKSQFDLE